MRLAAQHRVARVTADIEPIGSRRDLPAGLGGVILGEDAGLDRQGHALGLTRRQVHLLEAGQAPAGASIATDNAFLLKAELGKNETED